MVSFPNGKINLGLRITGKREDGFHDIETVFYPIPIHDIVEVVASDKLSFNVAGLVVEGPSENNLCLKAFKLLKNDYPALPDASIFLYKNIPIGAGLGGGSADAVACLQLLNAMGGLGLTEKQLSEYALQLGSDCPFFLVNKPCFAEGRGEIFNPLAIDLSNYDIMIINPGIHINTGWAFSELNNFSKPGQLRYALEQPVSSWKNTVINDFEEVVNQSHPETKEIKELLYAKGASFASLSGTGSTVFGLFERGNKPDLHFPSTYFLKWL